MAGGAGTGKSYLLDKLQLHSLPIHNVDKYVENPDHEFHNNLGASSRQVAKDAAASVEKRESFVWDTTAANSKNVINLIDKGYDVFMVMVYAHPVIPFIANSKRKRKVPKVAVFGTWRDVYSKIEEYYKLLKGNVAIYVNDHGGKYNTYIEGFNTAAKNGAEGIADYLQQLAEKEGIGGSSFFIPVEMSSEEEEEFKKASSHLDYDRDNRSVDKKLKVAFLKTFQNNGAGPGDDKMKEVLKKARESQEKDREKERAVFENIAELVYSDKFQSLLTHSSAKEVDQKVQTFLS